MIAPRVGAAALALTLLGATGADAQAPTGEAASPGFEIVGETFLAILVRDDVRAADWYARVLSLGQLRHMEAGEGRTSIRILRGGGLTIELIRVADAVEPTAPRTYGHFKAGFWVDDIAAVRDWLESQDVDLDARTFVDPALSARSFVFRDPEGNRIQVFQRCEGDCQSPGAGGT